MVQLGGIQAADFVAVNRSLSRWIVSGPTKSNISFDRAGKTMATNAFLGSRRFSGPTGLPLKALTECSLQDRFYTWVGLSGKRYVCTVFTIGDETAICDFSDAVVIGVVNSGGHKRPICVLLPSDFGISGRRHAAEAALALGANEWHIHFTPDYGKLASDLAAY